MLEIREMTLLDGEDMEGRVSVLKLKGAYDTETETWIGEPSRWRTVLLIDETEQATSLLSPEQLTYVQTVWDKYRKPAETPAEQTIEQQV